MSSSEFPAVQLDQDLPLAKLYLGPLEISITKFCNQFDDVSSNLDLPYEANTPLNAWIRY